ncbi:uncharacterized protein IL334_003428 [Kwoniella shivajii]|uniref:Uncharacterized protein n=1 Tax=Kwoniella shivajii TaxID=564305 RepID=A0ABZ1CZA1_9TREE|nr:hypothetical protein IL334_003428 [Kwoniella shivajii]
MTTDQQVENSSILDLQQDDYFARYDDVINTAAAAAVSLDPSLFALAAQVQAVAHAHAQGIDIDFNIDPTFIDVDDNLLNLNGIGLGSASELGNQVIDPSLFEIAQVVQDVNNGKIKLDDPSLLPVQSHTQNQNQNQNQAHVDHIQNHDGLTENQQGDGLHLDVEIDPTLREIVNSLTNAQQSSHATQGLSQAQAAAAIGAHLTDAEERERLQQSLQTTLEDLTQASFGSLFPSNYPQSPSSHNFLDLAPDAQNPNDPSHPNHQSQAGPSSHHHLTSTAQSVNSPNLSESHRSHVEYGSKRGRGRPKGSKNKHRSIPIPKPPKPKPPGPPAKPKGRPPKERDPEEQADYELRKQERALGIKRRKGRPRKFPGYLVREMRLKKNREEFNELLKGHRERQSFEDDEDDEDEDDEDDDDDEDDTDEDDEDGNQTMNANQHQQSLEGIMMDVDGLRQALSENTNSNPHSNSNLHHQHTGHNQDVEEDFGNWSVQDGQTLLDVVGMGTGPNGSEHTMEGVFGIRHG